MGKRLPPGPLWLKRTSKTGVENHTHNLIRAISNFGRFMGLDFIPAATVKRLNDDPYFKFVFAGLIILPVAIFETNTPSIVAEREHMTTLLRHPEKTTSEDLYEGLFTYINNFYLYMPGGALRGYYDRVPIQAPSIVRAADRVRYITGLIDKALERRGLLEKAEQMTHDYNSAESKRSTEDWYEQHLPFMKLCFEVFVELMDTHRLSWHQLYA